MLVTCSVEDCENVAHARGLVQDPLQSMAPLWRSSCSVAEQHDC